MKNRCAGYTLIEVTIAAAILTIMLGSGILAMQASQRMFQETVSSGIVNKKANRALNRIARSMTGAGRTTLTISANGDVASFQKVTGWNAGSSTWTDDVEVRLQYETGELDNGIDDDGDGMIDECQVLLTEDLGQPTERSSVIVKGVREFLEGEDPDGVDNNGNLLEDERGLSFELQGNALVMRLSLQRIMPEGGIGLRTLSTTIALRN